MDIVGRNGKRLLVIQILLIKTSGTHRECRVLFEVIFMYSLIHLVNHTHTYHLTFNKYFFPFFFFFWSFQGCTPGIWRFPGQGSNWRCCCRPMPGPQHCQIRAAFAIYTTAHSNTESLTRWARPGIEPATSWFLDRIILLCHDGNSFSFLSFLFFFTNISLFLGGGVFFCLFQSRFLQHMEVPRLGV